MHVLVIEPNPALRKGLQNRFSSCGWNVCAVRDIEDFLGLEGARTRFDVITLEFAANRKGAEARSQDLKRVVEATLAPVLVVSRHGAPEDIIACMDAGAAQYVVKPFVVVTANEWQVITSWIRRLDQRQRKSQQIREKSIVKITDRMIVDHHLRCVMIDGVRVDFTADHFRVFEVLLEKRGILMHSDAVARKMETRSNHLCNTVCVHVYRMRKKIDQRLGEGAGDIILEGRQSGPERGIRIPSYAELASVDFSRLPGQEKISKRAKSSEIAHKSMLTTCNY